MSWLRIDDSFDSHPKILALRTDNRRWTWQRILIYTTRYGTDLVPNAINEIIPKATPAFIQDCITLGLIDIDQKGLKHVHNWQKYQAGDPAKAARQRRWRNNTVDAPVDAPVDAQVDAPVDASRVGARAWPGPTQPVVSSSPALTRPPAVKNGRENEQAEHPYLQRLLAAVAPTNDATLKILRATRDKPEAAIINAYEASQGPGVKDPLAVALAELKRHGQANSQP